MAKIVRLTESDLVRLVNKVLNEQPDASMAKDLSNMVKSSMMNNNVIKIKLNGEMSDVVSKPTSKQSWGCSFNYSERGQMGQSFFNFNCNESRITTTNSRNVTEKSTWTTLKASPQAVELLKKACGCSSYVSNSSNQSTSNYV